MRHLNYFVQFSVSRTLPVIAGVALASIIAAVAPTTPAQEVQLEIKPPWQRVLQGENAKKAAGFEKRIAQLEAEDKYPGAIDVASELISFRKSVQGGDHWETIDADIRLQTARIIAMWPVQQRTEWRRVLALGAKATALWKADRNVDAQPLLEQYLAAHREALGDDHPGTATSYNNVAANLQALGNYTEAEMMLKKALAICRRVLGEEHPSTAAAYRNVSVNLTTQGKYSDAQPLLKKAVDSCRRVFGDDHPQTALAYDSIGHNLHALGQYGEALAFFQRGLNIDRANYGDNHANLATSYNNVATSLSELARHSEAQEQYRKALDIYLRSVGEVHADTATAYNNLAVSLNMQGKYVDAQPLGQKALDIRRRLFGNDHIVTAESLSNVAANLDDLARYSEALPLHHKALQIRKQSVGTHIDIVNSYTNLASNLRAQGRYAEAQPLTQQALFVCRRLFGDDHPATASCYNNLAGALESQGKYFEARQLHEEALAISRRLFGEQNHHTARSYHNLAGNLQEQRKYKDAQLLFERSLEIRRSIFGDEHLDTAYSYSALGLNLIHQGNFGDAQHWGQKALDIRSRMLVEGHPDIALSANNLAISLAASGNVRQAKSLLQQTLDMRLRVLGEYHDSTFASYMNMAVISVLERDYTEARRTLERASRTFEAARLATANRGRDRMTIAIAKNSPYPYLSTVLARSGHLSHAFDALENDLARGSLDESLTRVGTSLSGDEQRRRLDISRRLDVLQSQSLDLVTHPIQEPDRDQKLDRVLNERKELEAQLTNLAVVVNRREISSLNQIRDAIQYGAAWFACVDVDAFGGYMQEHWGCVLRATGEPRWEQLLGSGPNGKWTKADSELPEAFRSALSRSASSNEIRDLAQKLYVQRLQPLEKHLDGVKRLFVVPVNAMAGIPVEVLTDKYTVSYVPSGTFLARLAERPKPTGNRALAVGDPAYSATEKPTELPLAPSGLLVTQVALGSNAAKAHLQPNDVILKYAGVELTSVEQLAKLVEEQAEKPTVAVTLWRDGQTTVRELAPGQLGVVLDKRAAPEALSAKRNVDQLLLGLSRGGEWQELPGTAVEAARLKSLLGDSVTTLLRSQASEQALEHLRAKDELKEFRYLHFATHGEANNVRSFESALILAQDQVSKDIPKGDEKYYDGKLTANEVIENWKLNADLVTLSACESALGRPGGGDGLLGFAQAFLAAGSRAVCLSLWKVDDTATALLMDRFYQNLLGKRVGMDQPMPKAAALADAKQWLRNLSSDDALRIIAKLNNGAVRGKGRKALPLVNVPKSPDSNSPASIKPYNHPKYWAAFILIGDPN